MINTWEPSTLCPNVKAGERVRKFDHTFEWTHRHVKGMELEKLRGMGDLICDEALTHLKGADKVQTMLDLVQTRDCPLIVRQLNEQLHQEPDWVRHDQIRRGQEFFWSYQPLCMMVLLNASLVGGFGARRIVSTLKCTNRLGREDTAWRRLMETALMVFDVMSYDELRPSGRGWWAAVKVRLLHAQVRRHVLRLPVYDATRDGIPINQEDMLSTLIVFSATVIFSLRRIGVNVTEAQADDYIAAWRYVGYLLGIDVYSHYFANYSEAIVLYESVMMHLLDPDDACKGIAHNVLMACSYKAPMYTTYFASVARTRLLLGNVWADHLNLPQTPFHTFFVPYQVRLLKSIIDIALYFNRKWTIRSFQRFGYRTLNRLLHHEMPTYQLNTKLTTPNSPTHLPSLLFATLITFFPILLVTTSIFISLIVYHSFSTPPSKAQSLLEGSSLWSLV